MDAGEQVDEPRQVRRLRELLGVRLNVDELDSILATYFDGRTLRHFAKDAPFPVQIEQMLLSFNRSGEMDILLQALRTETPTLEGEIDEIENDNSSDSRDTIWRPDKDPLEHLHWFDRDVESSDIDNFMRALKRDPFSERPILVAIAARRDDGYSFSIKRFNLEVLSGVFGLTTLENDPKSVAWEPGVRPEFAFRKFAYRQIANKDEAELKKWDVKRLIEELAKVVDGRTFLIEVTAERIDSRAAEDLKDYLDLWAQLGRRAAPLVVYFTFVVDSTKPQADERLGRARECIAKALQGLQDKLVVVEPICLKECWPEHIARWCEDIRRYVGDQIASDTQRYLERGLQQKTNFRLGDVVATLKKAKGIKGM